MDSRELKKFRRQSGLKQAELAELLETPYGTYVSWEKGNRRVPGILNVALRTVKADLEKRTEKGGEK